MKHSDLILHHFDHRALTHIRYALKWGGPVATMLLDIDLDSGLAVSMVPDDASAESIYAFEWGGVYSTSQHRRWITDEVFEYLKSRRNGWLLVETCGHLSDPHLDRYGPHVIINQEICTIATTLESDRIDIENALREARGYPPLVAMLADAPDDFGVGARRSLGPTELARLVGRCEGILVGAWDHEGAIIWWRSGQGKRL